MAHRRTGHMFPQTTCVDPSKIHSLFGSPLEGISVCRAAFLQLLGIGRARLARTKKTFRGEDARKYGLSSADYV